MFQQPLELKFSFYYINQSGVPKGLWPVSGSLTRETICLGNISLGYKTILNCICRDSRLILSLDPQEIKNSTIAKHLIDDNLLVLDISWFKSKNLKFFIDRSCSSHLAKKHQRELQCEGKGQEFRSVTCPECGATVDLSLLNKTPYVYCRFCETIFQEEGELKTSGLSYRQCDECGWFDRVQGYTEFYFFFFFVSYGYSWKRRYLCDTCVNRVFWKILLVNLIFIMGIFPALWMKIKSLIGRDHNLQNLVKANTFAKKGHCTEANAIYGELYKRYPKHPGLLLNEGFGYLNREDTQTAWGLLQESIQNCSNYVPAVRVMNSLQDD